MKSILILLVAIPLFSFIASTDAPINNAKTVLVKIDGECAMCKMAIEQAGNLKKTVLVSWDQATKLATLMYDAKKTNTSSILKRIALAGFDNEEFLAPDEVYALLPSCCQYLRIHKTEPKKVIPIEVIHQHEIDPSTTMNDTNLDPKINPNSSNETKRSNEQSDTISTSAHKIDHNIESNNQDEVKSVPKEKKTDQPTVKPKASPNKPTINEHADHTTTSVPKTKANPLTPVFDQYFALKDMLVKTDGPNAALQAVALTKEIGSINMSSLNDEVHLVWMNVLKDLESTSSQISKTKDPARQRKVFITLSKNMYSLIKVSKHETPVYVQHCPMANDGKGADWLSKETAIKNPYFGAQMMTCGKTVETIK